MNECHFTGNFVRDPEVKTFQSGKQKVSFTLAISHRFKNAEGQNEKKAFFVDFEAWGATATTIDKYFKKGDGIIISSAMLMQDTWKNTEGQNRSKLYFRVNSFEFPPNRKNRDQEREEDKNYDEPVASGAGTENEDIPF